MGWLPSRNRESETSLSGFMGQTDVNSSRKYSDREWKRNRLVATRYYQREIERERERRNHALALSRIAFANDSNRNEISLSLSLFPPFTRGEQRSTVFQLFPTQRVIRFNALDKHVDRSGLVSGRNVDSGKCTFRRKIGLNNAPLPANHDHLRRFKAAHYHQKISIGPR